MSKIKLKSKEGEVFEIDVATARAIGTLRTMLDLLGEGDEDEVIPLPIVSSKMMRKVIDWAKHHREDGTSIEEDSETFSILEWETLFFEEDSSTLSQLIDVADYLDIPRLRIAAFKVYFDVASRSDMDGLCQLYNKALRLHHPAGPGPSKDA